MKPDELKKAGERLYGRQWRSKLANVLQKNPATIWRYASGVTPIPPLVEFMIKTLLKSKKP